MATARKPKAPPRPPAPLDAAKLERMFRADYLPATRAKDTLEANPRGLFGGLFLKIALDLFFKWLTERNVVTPRARGAASRGLSADAILDDFIDWATSALGGPWADFLRDALKTLAPLLVKYLRGFVVEPIAAGGPVA